MTTRRTALALAAGAALAPRVAEAAPKAELWSRWEGQDAGSTRTVDHAAFGKLLGTHIVKSPDGINRFAYAKIQPAEKQALDAYVAALAGTAPTQLSRAEQRAYWINLYNALTVKTVLEHYPVKSIRDISISPGLFASGPWGKKLVRIEGEEVSLDDIEHRILRPIWRDARTHYAVNCASIGCPNLAAEPYTPATMERLLDEGAKAYVGHPRGARFEGEKLITSSIYEWFRADFGGNEAGVIKHLAQYATGEKAQRLAAATRISDDAYDWGLNDAGR